MPLTRITIEEVGSSAPVDKRWLCEMEVGNAGTFRTVHVQKASLSEILKEIDRQYTGKSTMELLAELPKKRKPGRQPGWRKPQPALSPVERPLPVHREEVSAFVYDKVLSESDEEEVR